MNEVKKITKSTIIYLFGSVSSKLVAFFMLKVYTSYITPLDFGTYDVSITYSMLISSVIFLDIWSGIMRFMFDYRENKEKYNVIQSGGVIFLGSVIVYSLVFFIFANAINLKYMNYVYAYGLSLCFQNLFGYLARAFGYNLRFAISGIASTVINASMNIILIVILGMDYKALYISYILGVLVQCIMLEQKVHVIPNIKRSKVNWKITKEIFRFSLPLSVNSVSYWLLTSYSKIVISQQLGNEYNGYYAVASKFSVIITLLSLAFSMAWQELAFGKAKYDSETGAFYSKATDLYIKVLFIGSVILIPLIYMVFPYFVADSYSEAKTIIPIYIFATVLSIFSTFLGNILTAYKKTTTIFMSTLTAAIVNIVVLHLLIGRIGLLAAPIALFLGYALNNFMRIILIKKIIVYKFYLKKFIYIIPVSIAIIMVFNSGVLWLNLLTMVLAIMIVIIFYRTHIKRFIIGLNLFNRKVK